MLEDHFHSAVISAKQTILWNQVYPFILAERSGGTPLGLTQGSHCRDWQQPCAQCCVPTEIPNQGSGMRTTVRPDASHPSLVSGNEENSGLFSLCNKPSLICHLVLGRALGEQ